MLLRARVRPGERVRLPLRSGLPRLTGHVRRRGLLRVLRGRPGRARRGLRLGRRRLLPALLLHPGAGVRGVRLGAVRLLGRLSAVRRSGRLLLLGLSPVRLLRVRCLRLRRSDTATDCGVSTPAAT